MFLRFNRFLGLSKDQLAPAALAPAAFAPAALALTIPSVPSPTSSPVASPHNPHLVSVTQTEYVVFLSVSHVYRCRCSALLSYLVYI